MEDSVVFYRGFYEAIKVQPRDVQVEAYTAIMEYGLNGVEIGNLKPIASSLFAIAKPIIKANIARRNNGKKGGAPKGNINARKQPKNNQETTKKQPNINDNILSSNKFSDNNIISSNNSSSTTLTREDEFFVDVKKSEIWLDSMSMKFRMEIPQLLNRLNDFALDNKCREITHTSLSDYKRHFNDWLRIRLNSEKQQQHGNNKQSDRQSKTERDKCFIEHIAKKISGS